MFMRIAAGRKEREVDPAVTVLRACVVEADHDPSVDEVPRRRLQEMLKFVEMMDRWYAQMLTVPRPRLAALIRLGAKVLSFLPARQRK
jgi:DNA-binding transcriptional regulator GbsR (MarR family)